MDPIRDFYCDKLRVRVFETRKEMGDCAGGEAAACIKRLLEQKDTVNVMFAAAPSQNETLAALCRDDEIDWTRVNAFHMDDYVGLDPSHPALFRNYLKRTIFDRKPFRTVSFIDGNAPDAEAEAERYGKLLCENPLDVCIMGIGENGHIAFNDPPAADFEDPKTVKLVELDHRCRVQQVNDGCFERVELVPAYALTVTVTGLCAAEYMFCSVPSATKAEAVTRMLRGEISTACPATILRRQENAFLYTDAEAGSGIL